MLLNTHIPQKFGDLDQKVDLSTALGTFVAWAQFKCL